MTEQRIIFRPQWIVDGTGSPPIEGHAVIVEGNQITVLAPWGDISPYPHDRVIDLPNTTLLPGLINNHVHLILPGDNTPFTPWIDHQSDATLALLAAHNSRVALRAGVTTVRDCGGRGRVVLDVRNAQATNITQGARIITCGWTVTISGGHTRHFGGEVDGAAAIQRMVRQIVSAGADYVKVMASGGGTPGSLAEYPSFTENELRTLVDTAHGLGRRVSAHCTNAAATLNAIAARVDLIEHGMFFCPDGLPHFDEEVAARLAESGIPVTPTLQVDRDLVDQLPDGPERTLWQSRNAVHRQAIRRFHELGVPILAGSDAGWRATAFDTFWKELDELAACGLTPVEVIHAATGGPGKALGWQDRLGRIASGMAADLLVVSGNLGENLGCIRNINLVMQNGAAVFGPLEFSI